MNIAQVNFKATSAPKDFAESIKQTGFAVINNHPVDQKILDEVYSEWSNFFKSEQKLKYRFDPKIQSGYFPFRSENAKDSPIKDLKEFYHLYKEEDLPSECNSSTLALRRSLIEMASILLSWLDEYTPSSIRSQFSMPLSQMIVNSKTTLLRVLHYPPIQGDIEQGAIRAAAHEDINLITLLPAATAAGLQVKDNFGKWHDVPCDPGSIVVNAGDMLQLASDGYYRSTTHQVVNPIGSAAQTSRYSLPLFLHPCEDVYLGGGLNARQYLDQRLRELGLK